MILRPFLKRSSATIFRISSITYSPLHPSCCSQQESHLRTCIDRRSRRETYDTERRKVEMGEEDLLTIYDQGRLTQKLFSCVDIACASCAYLMARARKGGKEGERGRKRSNYDLRVNLVWSYSKTSPSISRHIISFSLGRVHAP